MKIERNKRRDLGLSDENIDSSYQPEDYQAALYEMQDPLISNSVLTGEAAIPHQKRSSSNKVRPLTNEEILLEKQANEKIQNELNYQISQGNVPKPSPARSIVTELSKPPQINKNDPLDQAINKLLNGNRNNLKAASSSNGASSASSLNSNTKANSNTNVNLNVNAKSVSTFDSFLKSKQNLNQINKQSTNENEIKSELQSQYNTNIQSRIDINPQVEVEVNRNIQKQTETQIIEKKLLQKELAITANALTLLRAHYGNPTEQTGRLKHSEAIKLAESLTEVINLFNQEIIRDTDELTEDTLNEIETVELLTEYNTDNTDNIQYNESIKESTDLSQSNSNVNLNLKLHSQHTLSNQVSYITFNHKFIH